MNHPWITADEALRRGYGDNPLLEALGPMPDIANLTKLLWHRPLSRVPWQQVRSAERAPLLNLMEDHVVPTPMTTTAAQVFLSLIHQHYLRRNPLHARVRMQVHALAEHRGKEISRLPWFNGSARAMALRGITGSGKSVTADRLASLLPQTVLHGPCQAAGWVQMQQLNYVRVQMSGDSSRAGFLNQILAQIDSVLGTSYHDQYAVKSKWTVEKMMVVVGIILARHFCGALIIEELQERNFAEGVSREIMLLFFLRLLNFGIPIVLIGNPLGFRAFDHFSQDVRRLYSAGCYDLWPSDHVDDAGWDDYYLPGLAQFNLLDKPHVWTPETQSLVKELTGGVPGFMGTLWHACQRDALASGKDKIERADFVAAANDPALTPNRPLMRALHERDVVALSACEDVPYDDFAARWGIDLDVAFGRKAEGQDGAPMAASPRADPDAVEPSFLRAERKHKAKKARTARAAAKPVPAFDPSDVRSTETLNALLKGLTILREATDAEAASTQQKKAA